MAEDGVPRLLVLDDERIIANTVCMIANQSGVEASKDSTGPGFVRGHDVSRAAKVREILRALASVGDGSWPSTLRFALRGNTFP